MQKNDECPNCKCGTLDKNCTDLVCQGECGMIWTPENVLDYYAALIKPSWEE